ncbi:hypothetical protein B0H65DRAFT_418492 [Neurospora tetraspora]|uniref:Uncharacterized protein n=1 Tax=Neurospora tetraspora TaxID=94610 RepID=A0AAE0MVS5_9PEZI|nr:hypothetical protein B0H65DRAFT_418492 [Neurospora tetraspora]
MESSSETIPLQTQPQQQALFAGTATNATPEKGTANREVSKWKPGIVRRFPIFGLIPMMLSIACTAIAVAVILLSEGTPVDGWWSGVRQPGVLLAYTSTVANTLMAISFVKGSVVFFWTQAVMGEMRISSLHYYWMGSTGILGALKAICLRKATRCPILVAITTLLRGPLIQRASFVVNVPVAGGTIDLQVQPDMDNDWGGTTDASHTQVYFHPHFSTVIAEFLSKTQITIGGEKCQDCSFEIQAFGFNVTNCTSEATDKYDFADIDNWGTSITLFKTNVIVSDSFNYGKSLTITAVRKNTQDCTGQLIEEVCELVPASINYHLNLKGDIATFKSDNWKDDSALRHLYHVEQPTTPRNMTVPSPPENSDWVPTETTILPLQRIGQAIFKSELEVNMSFTGSSHTWSSTTAQEQVLPKIFFAGRKSLESDDYCLEYYTSPMDYIIKNYRELAFRISVRAGAEKKLNQTVPYISHLVHAKYAASVPSLILGIIISVLGLLATLILFWGWWKMGRSFSMSPLELANAILCPGPDPSTETGNGDIELELSTIFANCSSNASAEKLAKQVGQKVVEADRKQLEPTLQYGVLESTGRLAFGFTKSGLVREPKEGELL